jgi:hypothetical protein
MLALRINSRQSLEPSERRVDEEQSVIAILAT